MPAVCPCGRTASSLCFGAETSAPFRDVATTQSLTLPFLNAGIIVLKRVDNDMRLVMSGWSARDIQRIVVAIAVLIATPLYVICGVLHVCMAGHMRHAPYPVWHYFIDGGWAACFVITGVLSWKSNLRLRKTAAGFAAVLLLSRLVLGSGGGIFFLLELPLLVVLVVVAVRGLFSGAPDWTQVSEEMRQRHRRRVCRGWALALGIPVATGLLARSGFRGFWLFKSWTAQEIVVQEIPTSREIALSRFDACVIRLPNHRTVALWCERADGSDDDELDYSYGERPFRELESEKIQLPGGGITYGDYLSYIRSGGVTTYSGDDSREVVLYADQYCLTIVTKGKARQKLPLTVSVRLATEEEQAPRERKRAH